MTSCTADSLRQFIDQYRRCNGRLPRLRECVDHFDGNLLNVLMCLGELEPATADEYRRLAREEHASRERKTGKLVGK